MFVNSDKTGQEVSDQHKVPGEGVGHALHHLGPDQLLEAGGGHRLGPLQGQAKGAVPDQAGGHSKSTGDSEQDCVVVHLLHAEILNKDDIKMNLTLYLSSLPGEGHRSEHLHWAMGS